MTYIERMHLQITTPVFGSVAWNSHGVRPDNATRSRLYHHLRTLGYQAMEALRWAYGPPQLPAIEWLEMMVGPL